jgi:[Skp1-protein]-hydroxyproline N-acetylglucosaminyltransferase
MDGKVETKSKSRRSRARTTTPTSVSSGASRLLLLVLGIVALVFVLTTSLLAFHLPDANPASEPNRDAVTEGKQQEKESPVLRQRPQHEQSKGPPHLYPPVPYLPPHATVENKEALIDDTIRENKPTIAGIHAILQNFFRDLHSENHRIADMHVVDRIPLRDEVVLTYQKLVQRHLAPLDEAYRGRPTFPIREDDSVFCSLASFRDHLLGATLKEAFRKAKNPDKIFVGAIVQNCFGDEYTCQTGVQVVGTRDDGSPITKISDTVPDKNGIEEFCNDEDYKKYCERGQIRALYVNETEALGPSMARYHASKLWGGETYYVQADAHLRFSPDWDARYIAEVQAAKSYPKAVLSAYPPGFNEDDKSEYIGGTSGSRLCTCEFSTSDVEEYIIRINTGTKCKGSFPGPTQVAFIAAGFFFARAEFLTDVPFDPYLPWTFMGEEIALSMRAWTAGWNIYAPRENLIAHQYRPGRMGLPKFWGSVGQTYGRPGPGFSNFVQSRIIKRIKHMVGYLDVSREAVEAEGDGMVLIDSEHYSLGKVRTREAYLNFTHINLEKMTCGNMPWCNKCTLE